ncbi:hypothetical protein EJ419_01010 [Alloscardovia theropitheci]|uniref:Uncharacterized protein n=1 Tax=Alloscardovia theropitheci TaxID=2496842 RepID=A0A4V2MU51_9BIFI|nr:hypothetical protein [Alloscardovia theropitheci]TCD54999.1 hypothetical protein EJ419_01010 [Alloscardovia theropitheci]
MTFTEFIKNNIFIIIIAIAAIVGIVRFGIIAPNTLLMWLWIAVLIINVITLGIRWSSRKK